jgi:hypothetical protein
MDNEKVIKTEVQWGVVLDDRGSVEFYEEEDAKTISAMSSLPLVRITSEYFAPVEN